MSAPPFMQLYVADYLGDTRHLTTEQHGAYLLLLMCMWRSGGRLPNDAGKLARLTGCTPSRWSKISEEVLAFFDVDGAEIVHGRITFELEKASEKSIKRAAAGSRGGKANARKTQDNAEAIAADLPKHSSEPDIRDNSEAIASSQRPKAPQPKGTKRAPETWKPGAVTIARLTAEGFSSGDLERALTRMRDHEFRTPHTDWDAAFRNWVRRDADHKPRRADDRTDYDRKLDARQANLAAHDRGADLAARLREDH